MDMGKLLSYQPNRGIKHPQDGEEEEQKMHQKQTGTQERGYYQQKEMMVVEEAEDDKKWLLQIIDRKDNPQKFMKSQLDLHDIIQKTHVVATMPDLYHLLLELNAVQSLLGLLGHDNRDVSIAGVDLNQELTDIDIFYESEEGTEVLINALVEEQVIALLARNVERLDESVKEAANGVYNTLVIVETMAEF
ncbi:hypothetical protein P7K49_038103 [Saguinus oedipus]|uniref:Beta-catenin-like protein 1 N-terminal domain-containing protein n=1 Tax=Saguinus oedipus TaxID=9490 RepID=A0ABQ9TF45_SAGOE|nr:hypothetical protein P7K49_038103 [Saguinus oedipus]